MFFLAQTVLHTHLIVTIIANDFSSNSENSQLDQLGTVQKMVTELIITHSGRVETLTAHTRRSQNKRKMKAW